MTGADSIGVAGGGGAGGTSASRWQADTARQSAATAESRESTVGSPIPQPSMPFAEFEPTSS